MNIYVFLVILISVHSLWATPIERCADIFRRSFSDTSKETPFTILSIAYSPVLEKEDGQLIYLSHLSLIQKYLASNSQMYQQFIVPYYDPVTLVLTPYQHFLQNLGLKAIYQAYEKSLEPTLYHLIQNIESSLAKNRQLFILIQKENNDSRLQSEENVLGFFRVFDGSRYASGPRVMSNPQTHMEVLLEAQGKSTQIVDLMRAKGFTIFELGKYYLKNGISPKELVKVRNEIRKWLIDTLNEYSEEDLKNTVFFAHVASIGNQKRNEKDYGFKVVDRNLSNGLDENENILMIDGSQLLKNLTEVVTTQQP